MNHVPLFQRVTNYRRREERCTLSPTAREKCPAIYCSKIEGEQQNIKKSLWGGLFLLNLKEGDASSLFS